MPILFLQTGNSLKNWLQHNYRPITYQIRFVYKLTVISFWKLAISHTEHWNVMKLYCWKYFQLVIFSDFFTQIIIILSWISDVFSASVADERIQNDRPDSCEPWPTRTATVELFGQKSKQIPQILIKTQRRRFQNVVISLKCDY